MASNYLRLFIVGGFVLLFSLLVFPPMHSALGAVDTSSLTGAGRYIDKAWIVAQPYLLLAILAYAIYVFTHRR